jgi:ABC-type amino acid transport/signal transduction systems, periplasmic component/domain
MKSMKVASTAAAVVFATSQIAVAATLDDVKARGELRCGVSGGVPGFSAPDDSGRMQGIDAAVCDAIAAAVLGDSSKVTFIPLTAKERFTALASGEIDVLSRNTTHTLTREASLGLNFTYYNYIDGQGFMVKKDLGVSSALELDGASICVQAGTTTELNMADYSVTTT